MVAPLLDNRLRLPKVVAYLAIEVFIPELVIEGLALAVLKG